MNYKHFTLNEFSKEYQNKDIYIKNNLILDYNQPYTISDYLDSTISKGSENIYISLLVYKADQAQDMKAYILTFWTKENHTLLKEIIKDIISQA